MKKLNFDERQMSLRYQIAQQGFSLTVVLLLADYLGYLFGVQLLPYPNNVFCILVISCTFVTIRRILKGCYIAPGRQFRDLKNNLWLILVLLMIVSIITVGGIVQSNQNSLPASSNSTPLSSVFCYLLLAGQGICYLWYLWREGHHKDDD